MKLIFHGGAKEVGRSCIELDTEGNRFILDAGLKFKEDGFDAPFKIFDLPNIDGLFLSHAHLDHTGALPLFKHFNLRCPIFTTEQTKEITDILLKDSYKIARIKHLHAAYEKIDLKKVYSSTKIINFDKPYSIKNVEFKFINAGHIPGSAMILLKLEGKKILYTGDFKLKDTNLMMGAGSLFSPQQNPNDLKDIDVLITESTYGNKPLPDLSAVEADFLNTIEETLKKGAVLIPVFSLGRSQEVLIMLSKRKWNVPIYFDGMSSTITKTILSRNPMFLKNKQVLANMFNRNVVVIKKEKQRQKIMNQRAIYVTTSGMMQGGPVLSYLENMWGNPNNTILLTGYQCKRTNGRTLLEEGYVYLNGWKTTIKCGIKKMDFTGHADDSELKEFVKKIAPKNVIFQHGDEESVNMMKTWAEQNTQCKVFAPAVSDEYEF